MGNGTHCKHGVHYGDVCGKCTAIYTEEELQAAITEAIEEDRAKRAAEEGKAEPRPGTDGGPAGLTELQEAGRVIIDLCTAMESVADVEGSASAEVKAAWANGCRWMASAPLVEAPKAAEGVEDAKVIWDGGYGMAQLALDSVRGMLYGRPDRRELWTLLARLDHPITWATGEFTAQWAFYNMLMAWTPEQCREFYAMLSRRPDFNPKAPNHEFSASEVDPSRCGLCLEHRRDHGTRPGGLRSIEQAAIEDIHRITNFSLSAHARLALIDSTIIEYRVRARKQAPQAPTAQSAPPPAGPALPPGHVTCHKCKGSGGSDDFNCPMCLGRGHYWNQSFPEPPPVEPPAPRPMELRAEADSVALKVWGPDTRPWGPKDAAVKQRLIFHYDMVDKECAREIAYRINSFEAPETQAGEAP